MEKWKVYATPSPRLGKQFPLNRTRTAYLCTSSAARTSQHRVAEFINLYRGVVDKTAPLSYCLVDGLFLTRCETSIERGEAEGLLVHALVYRVSSRSRAQTKSARTSSVASDKSSSSAWKQRQPVIVKRERQTASASGTRNGKVAAILS